MLFLKKISQIFILICFLAGVLIFSYRQESGSDSFNSMPDTAKPHSQDAPALSFDSQQRVEPKQDGEEIAISETDTTTPSIDFEKLRLENSDIYAWIQIPGTEIDYPVLQSEIDNFYLDNNIDGSQGLPGCIYSNKCNSKDFTDYNIVLYGHNMKNGSMFGSLKLFEDNDFFAEHEQIIIHTPQVQYVYQIYAAVKYNDNYIPELINVTSPDDVIIFDNILKSYETDKKIFRDNISLSTDDHLITLSTCVKGDADARYLVVGKRIE